MKKIINFIKKHIGEFFVIVGTGIFINNLFKFSYRVYGEYSEGLLPSLSTDGELISGAVSTYYYPDSAILLITFGSMLIVAGILIIRNKND